MPQWLLHSIEISGGFLAGLSLEFPPGLTCVIGPRGSGKSTLAEALRYAMGSGQTTAKSSRDLIAANLTNAVISVRTHAGTNGAAYLVRRSFRQSPVLSATDGRVITDVDLERGTFLPLDAFSSNEIEAIAEASLGEARRALLDDLCAQELTEIQRGAADHLRALAANRDAIRSKRAEIAAATEEAEELAEAPARLAALHEAPNSTDARVDLVQLERERDARRRDEQSLFGMQQALSARRRDLQQLRESCVRLVRSKSEALTPAITAADEVIASMCDDISALLGNIDARLVVAEGQIARIALDARNTRLAQDAAADEIEQRNQAASALARQRAEAERAVARLEMLGTLRIDAERELADLLAERRRLRGVYLLERERVSGVRVRVADQLQREAGAKVRVRVLRNADMLAYQQVLSTALQGARVRNHDEILAALTRLRPEDLAQLLMDPHPNEFEAQTGLGAERARKVFDAFREKIDPMELEVVPIDDRVSIELNVATAEEPRFKDAAELSRGQKCTALLPLLLARRSAPLIIDQPEDNLDNHFIFETVVESIRRLKPQRQMIFVTHNANIPVLAEAERVVVMDSDGRAGIVKKVGSIDDCRTEIIDLLEGGQEAFDRRSRRYGRG